MVAGRCVCLPLAAPVDEFTRASGCRTPFVGQAASNAEIPQQNARGIPAPEAQEPSRPASAANAYRVIGLRASFTQRWTAWRRGARGDQSPMRPAPTARRDVIAGRIVWGLLARKDRKKV